MPKFHYTTQDAERFNEKPTPADHQGATGDRHGSHTHPESVTHGAEKSNTTMTDEKVTEARALWASGEYSQLELANKYGISKSSMSCILLRQVWTHIPASSTPAVMTQASTENDGPTHALRYSRRAAERFWKKVDKSGGADACWLWTAACDDKGYGKFSTSTGHWEFAHRVSCIMAHGAIQDGLGVLHRCDRPGCVNPAHLFLGTRGDNAADRDAKGRVASGDKHGLRLHPEKAARGAACGSAKLTDEDVRVIRAMWDSGQHSQAELAHRFGVDKSTICNICHLKTWKHVADDPAA